MVGYRPERKHRYIYQGKLYEDIAWNDLAEVIEAFHWKINEWYIVPPDGILKAGFDQAFSLMALTCMLIDTLSQYYLGKTRSTQKTFKDFLKETIPPFDTQLPQPIEYTNPRGNPAQLETYADVLYVGFRCGILHECHIPLYGGLTGQDQLRGKMFDVDPDICTKYDDGRDCPTVRMDPTLIYPAVKTVFGQYINDLLTTDPNFDSRRELFKTKFSASFGEDLTNSKL
ncbi:hypothetical protein V5E97_35790 [Singulisphaera sp. Ch08]|uniref:Uncharacterized protein n=1 Tax=Singulisphaera sp. Ch08 TaxID=3120278 RepID=A0AAU7CEE3_9BACT